MTLPASGAISMSQVRTELGASGAISLGQASVRALAGVASGTIRMSNLYGKANAFNATISSHQADLNLRIWALANGWNGSTAATITVASGVHIYSTSTANAGLVIDGSWPAGVTLINNGYISGFGGKATVNTANITGGYAGNPGGNAISLGVNCSITNNSYIGGGGGSGGTACGTSSYGGSGAPGGSGAGGTAGANLYTNNLMANIQTVAGGAGGGPGSNGGNGAATAQGAYYGSAAGGSGRVFPGTGGAGAQAGGVVAQGAGAGSGGGQGIVVANAPGYGPVISGRTLGGGGGGWGASGGAGYSTTGDPYPCNSGAGGAAGGTGGIPTHTTTLRGAGGAGGKAVALNGYTVTWNAVGTRYGAIA
jgi:hypothetical protein